MNAPTHAELVARARADLVVSKNMLELVESGDAIVGATPNSLRLRAELTERIATLQRLLAKESSESKT